MGQAKQRGTCEERKKAAEDRSYQEFKVRKELEQRKPSPKHLALMAYLAGLGLLK